MVWKNKFASAGSPDMSALLRMYVATRRDLHTAVPNDVSISTGRGILSTGHRRSSVSTDATRFRITLAKEIAWSACAMGMAAPELKYHHRLGTCRTTRLKRGISEGLVTVCRQAGGRTSQCAQCSNAWKTHCSHFPTVGTRFRRRVKKISCWRVRKQARVQYGSEIDGLCSTHDRLFAGARRAFSHSTNWKSQEQKEPDSGRN